LRLGASDLFRLYSEKEWGCLVVWTDVDLYALIVLIVFLITTASLQLKQPRTKKQRLDWKECIFLLPLAPVLH